MKEKKYRSGFERYQDIAKIIKQQCIELEGEPVNLDNHEKTLYIWNGFKVYIADGGVEIHDKDEKVFLSAYNGLSRECQFGLSDYKFNFTGVYYPKLTDSFVDSRYQKIESNLSSEINNKPDIHLLPDKISSIVQTEIELAEGKEYKDEYSRNLNKQYIEQLRSALEFYEKIQELAKSEKSVDKNIEDLSSSQPTGAEKIIEYMKQNNLNAHDLSLALSMILARTTDRTNAEQHIVTEGNKDRENNENVMFEQ